MSLPEEQLPEDRSSLPSPFRERMPALPSDTWAQIDPFGPASLSDEKRDQVLKNLEAEVAGWNLAFAHADRTYDARVKRVDPAFVAYVKSIAGELPEYEKAIYAPGFPESSSLQDLVDDLGSGSARGNVVLQTFYTLHGADFRKTAATYDTAAEFFSNARETKSSNLEESHWQLLRCTVDLEALFTRGEIESIAPARHATFGIDHLAGAQYDAVLADIEQAYFPSDLSSE